MKQFLKILLCLAAFVYGIESLILNWYEVALPAWKFQASVFVCLSLLLLAGGVLDNDL